MLWRKLLRDLWRHRWQTVPILLVLGLGTAVFVAGFVGYDSLGASYRETQERTRLADMTLDITAVTPAEAGAVRALPGVADVDLQTVISLPLKVGANHRAEGRLVSIPAGGNQGLNQVVVETGHYPADNGEVLVEHHFAAYHNLKAGDTLRLDGPGGERLVKVAGVGVSAEYLWVSRNEFDLIPSAADFGVLFVPRPLLTDMGLADGAGTGNRLLYSLAPGADPDSVLAAVTAKLGAGRVLAHTARADLVGIKMLQDDIDGLAGVSVLVPIFFLTVVALVLASVMSRQVDRERPMVGTMLALGISRRTIMLHYLGYGLVTGAIATLLGSLAGVGLGNRFAAVYAGELLIPFVTLRVNGWAVLAGIGLGLAAATLACIMPARKAAALHPAEAMRPGPAAGAPRSPGSGRPGRAPMWWRLARRNALRHPSRTAGGIIGVVSALVLLIGTGGVTDSVFRLLNLALTGAPRYDLRVDFARPAPSAELAKPVQQIDGVRSVQTSLSLPVQLRHGDRSEQSVAQILPRTSPLQKVLTVGGQELVAGDGQVLVSEALAEELGLKAGDEVELVQGARTVRRTVGALSGTILSEPVVLHGSGAADAFGLADMATTVLITVAPGRREQVKDALQSLPGVLRISDQVLMRGQVNQLMGLGYLIIGVMFGSGAVLAGCILLGTVTLNVTERERELATMRADGHPMAGLAWLITVENLLTAAAGAVIGLPLGVLVLRQVVQLYDSTLFTMPFVVKPATLGLALVTVLAVMLLAEVPSLRHVARLNLAEATRARE